LILTSVYKAHYSYTSNALNVKLIAREKSVFDSHVKVAVLAEGEGSNSRSERALKAIGPATVNLRRPRVLSWCCGSVSWWLSPQFDSLL